ILVFALPVFNSFLDVSSLVAPCGSFCRSRWCWCKLTANLIRNFTHSAFHTKARNVAHHLICLLLGQVNRDHSSTSSYSPSLTLNSSPALMQPSSVSRGA